MGIKYVGVPPGSDPDVATEEYLLGLRAQNLPQATVDALIAAGMAPYATRTYVNDQDALNATKAYIDAGDATRLHLSQIDTPGGPVGLDEVGWLDPAILDIASTQRWPALPSSPDTYNPDVVSATAETTV